jgi:hypothetical protein
VKEARDIGKHAGATVAGIVESVNGNLIQLAGGLVTIDATGAKIIIERGDGATVADVRPGMLLFATLAESDVAPNAPLKGSVITVTRFSDATLLGPIQSVDTTEGTFTLLGRTIQVTPETSFGGFKRGGTPGLADLLPNQIVSVQTDNEGGRLVARAVLVISPIPPSVGTLHGTVKSIGADAWVIDRRGEDVTVVVNARTKIVNSPRVGDEVEVLYTVDGANAFVALSIVRFQRPVTDVQHFRGRVSAIEGSSWTIARTSGGPVTVVVNDKTKVQPGIAVGDEVEVLAHRRDDGTYVAITIVKRFF